MMRKRRSDCCTLLLSFVGGANVLLFFVSFAKSRSDERTLFRSLKNPEKFSVLPIAPMLPIEPTVVEQSMTILEGFRLSQFHAAPQLKRDAAADQGWKMPEGIALSLRNELSAFKGFRIERHEAKFPPQVRRRLLIARESSFLRRDVTRLSRLDCGRTSKLLRSFEASHSQVVEVAPSKSWRTSNESTLDVLFPVSSYVCPKGESSPSAPLRPFELNSPIDSALSVSRTVSDSLKRASNEATSLPMAVDPMSVTLADEENGTNASAMAAARNPYSVRKNAFKINSNSFPMIFGNEMRSYSAGDRLISVADSKYDETTTKAKSSEIIETQKLPHENDDFCLPSQDDSMSDDSSKSSGGCMTTSERSMHLGDHKPNDVDGMKGVERTLDGPIMEAETFRLPTPDSSSDEEESNNLDQCSSIQPKIALVKESIGSEHANPLVLTQHVSVLAPASLSSGTSSHSRVRFSLDGSVIGSLLRTDEASPQRILKQATKARNKRILAINDTPDSKTVQSRWADDLGATSFESHDVNYETLVCAVCQTDRLSKNDPLVLCDGSGPQRRCNLAVHVSCYTPNTIDLSKDEEWRCDPCNHVFHGGQLSCLRCSRCSRRQGILKQTSESGWAHFQCQAKPPRKLVNEGITRQPLKRLSPNRDRSPASLEAKHLRRKQVMRRFILDEAEASSIDGDADEQEEDVIAMEQEEEQLAIGFINDSSQLGYTQEGLEESDCDENAENIHRAVDVRRDKMRHFSTPVLNRRMQEQQASVEDSPWTDISRSVPDSTRGLGSMHFIRSVLEHHRKGARAEDIEAFYRDLEGSEAINESECSEDHLASCHSLHT
jgi:hypothetical protein